MTSEVFFLWFKNFCQKITEQPLLLLLDGHLSHVSTEVIQLAMVENIIILKFPAHVTDVLQPLDVSCFGPPKKKWSALLSHRSGFASARHALTKAEFVDEICSIWYECLSPSNIKNGFAATRIFPVNSVKYPRKRFNARLLQRYEVWRAEGKQQDMEIMAKSAVTPKKIKPSTNTEVTTSNSSEDFLLSPVCTGVCSIIGPKPTSDPGKGKEWVPMWIPSVIHPNAKLTPSKESEEEPCSSASTSFENIILEKIRTVSASQPKKKKNRYWSCCNFG